MNKLVKVLTVIAAIVVANTSTYAVAITFADRIGIIESGEPAGDADEQLYVNTLLSFSDLLTHTVDHGGSIGSHDYTRNNLLGIGATVPLGTKGAVGDNTVTGIAGAYLVLAKYDGPNGGDVLWYVASGDVELPEKSLGLWEGLNPRGNSNGGYDLSHYTVFTAPPGINPQSVPDAGGSVALMGIALMGMAAIRRNK